MDRGDKVTAADLDRAEAWPASPSAGRRARGAGPDSTPARRVTGPMANEIRTGLGLRLYRVAVPAREVSISAETASRSCPPATARYRHPLHSVGIARMGLVLLDHIAVEALAEVCVEERTVGVLLRGRASAVPKATGSAVNPLCIF